MACCPKFFDESKPSLVFLFFTAEKKQKREQHHDATQIGMGVNAYPGVYGAPQVSTVELTRIISASLPFLFSCQILCMWHLQVGS